MAVIASTSDDFYANYAFGTSQNRNNAVKVPKNADENRRLKFGHSEDDNADIAYLNVPIIVPSLLFTIVSFGCFIGAIIASLKTDYIPDEHTLLRGYIVQYGSSRFRCNSTIPIPADGLPSVLNLFELNVIGNVLFRYATCIPIVIRVFHAITIRNLLRHEYSTKFSNLHKVMADSMPVFTALETLMMALFSIVTVHEDFPEANRFFKIVFAMSSVINMLATTIVMFAFSSTADSFWDTVSISLKVLCLFIYTYFMPQYIQFHQSTITFPICHSIMPRLFALMEYSLIVVYALFHLSFLVDLRHISFVCFPRSSSGECEPIEPDNFKVGGKYEHCRAFEYNQRRIMSL